MTDRIATEDYVDGEVAGVTGSVSSVNTQTGAVVLTATDVGADASGAAAAAQAASQPIDSDLTAIAALTTTSYGRALLALADAAAGRTALGLGTAATHATGDYDAAGAAAAAQAASQPLDSDLTAIAALTTTTFGRSVLAAADAAALRTLAATVIGTNVQAWDADLDSLAAVGLTAAGLALLDDANAAAQRTTLGLGNVDNTADTGKPVSTAQQTALDLKLNAANPAVTGTPTGITKSHVGLGNVDNTSDATKAAATTTLTNHRVTPRVVTAASDTTPTPNADTTDVFLLTAQAAAATFGAPTGTPTDGQLLFIGLRDNGVARALTWNAAYSNGAFTLPSTTTINTSHSFTFRWSAARSLWELVGPQSAYDKGAVDFLLSAKAGVNPLAGDTLWGAKGDLVVATANDTAARLAVGAFGTAPLADTTATPGIIYGNPAALRDKWLTPSAVSPCYETLPRAMHSANGAIAATGVVRLVAIALPKNFTVNRISFTSATQGAVTPTHWWFSLCDNAYTTLRSTADQTTTAWAAGTEKRIVLSSAFTTTYEGVYYLAIMMTAATIITVYATPTLTNTVVVAIPPLLCVTGISGQTTAPADGTNLATSPSAAQVLPYAYVD